MSPPSSIPTRSTSASCGLGAIQRTCEVHGRGGKLHVGRDGSSKSAFSSRQVAPRSSLRKSALGSVPAYNSAVDRTYRKREDPRRRQLAVDPTAAAVSGPP